MRDPQKSPFSNLAQVDESAWSLKAEYVIAEPSGDQDGKDGSDLTLMYDGLRWIDGNGDKNHVSFRHSKGRNANFLFADGHAETLPKSVLPNLTDAQIKNLNNGPTSLKPWPRPLWRLDQK